MASEKNKNVQRAHLMLGAYWLYKMFRGEGMPRATLDVLRIQGNSLKKEHRERRSAEREAKNGSVRSAGRARAGLAAGNVSRSMPPRKRRPGDTDKELPGKILRAIFKKQRLF